MDDTSSWKEYRFRFLTHERQILTAIVYAADDETAAILFDKAYSRDVQEMLPA